MVLEWLHMGTIRHPHGIKGEFCIDWYADSPLLLRTPLWLQGHSGEAPCAIRILSIRTHKGRPLIQIAGVEDRTAAENLRGRKIFMRHVDLPEPKHNEAYVQDLLGCDVLLADGSRLGRLDHVEYPAGQEIWSILTDTGCEVLFPARSEFILSFDKNAAAVSIAPPEGLIELYLCPGPASAKRD